MSRQNIHAETNEEKIVTSDIDSIYYSDTTTYTQEEIQPGTNSKVGDLEHSKKDEEADIHELEK